VFGPDSTSAEIYESLVKPLVPWAWSGGVSTLFAYGQTGSGKTFTVSALERSVADTLMDGSLEGERTINVSIIELAGQTAYGEPQT
jgi:kinesin family protein 2/24